MEKWGISERHGRAYHPQSQGQIERFNQTLKTKLSRTSRQNKYITMLDEFVSQYNYTKHRVTKQKPIILFIGLVKTSLWQIWLILVCPGFDIGSSRLGGETNIKSWTDQYHLKLGENRQKFDIW